MAEGGIGSTFPAPGGLAPGEETMVSVDLVAPVKEGRFSVFFKLRNAVEESPGGGWKKFGQRLWCDIIVSTEPTGAATMVAAAALDSSPSSSSSSSSSSEDELDDEHRRRDGRHRGRNMKMAKKRGKKAHKLVKKRRRLERKVGFVKAKLARLEAKLAAVNRKLAHRSPSEQPPVATVVGEAVPVAEAPPAALTAVDDAELVGEAEKLQLE